QGGQDSADLIRNRVVVRQEDLVERYGVRGPVADGHDHRSLDQRVVRHRMAPEQLPNYEGRTAAQDSRAVDGGHQPLDGRPLEQPPDGAWQRAGAISHVSARLRIPSQTSRSVSRLTRSPGALKAVQRSLAGAAPRELTLPLPSRRDEV